MTAFDIGLWSFGLLLILIYSGLYIPVAMALTSFLAVWAIRGDFEMAGNLLGLAAANSLASYEFGVVPLFVLMGLLISIADLGKDTFDVAHLACRRIKGGLGVTTVVANAIFAAITGVSIASAAVFTRVAVPEMLRHNYNGRFAVGVVAGSSVLGMLIPPSLLLIIYGILTEAPISDLFVAGVLPGVLLAFGFVLCIVVMATFFPTSVMKPTPEGQAEAEGDQMTLTQALLKLVPIATLIALVLGGIYGGLFTPTESGAVGALGAFLLAIVKRRLTFAKLWRVLVETGHITASIAALAIGATMYSRMLALSGLPSHLGMWMAEANLDFYGFIFAFIVIVIFLGTILDSVSIMLVMLPLVLPILTAMNADLVWFGVVTVIAVEIGLLTPPFGLAVFTIKATLNNSKISAADIFIGALPFVLVMILTLAVVVLVPWFTYALL